MKSQVVKILLENNLDPNKFNIDDLYNIGKKNIINNIEYYFDKEYSCKSVLTGLFKDGINNYINENKIKSELESLVAERTSKINKENIKISNKNNDLTKSIEYAKSLQDAILPQLSKIKKYLPKSFIFYQPKDIIGGDFYWFDIIGNYIYFAVADCTGHGVPGGMVSVVCANALKRCINELKIFETDKILNKTREIVIETFNQNGQNINDGMDIILCRLDYQSNELQFSGANRPLYIIKKGKQLEEFKSDKQPIGKYIVSNDFTKNTIEINNGDIIYLFSDGYVDQFGGENLSKLKSSSLKSFLEEIKNDNITIQEVLVIDKFKKWKGEEEQTDDVCIWGIEI